MAKLNAGGELPQDLPKELQVRYEVRDSSTLAAEEVTGKTITPVSVPAPSAPVSGLATKPAKKAKREKKPQAAAPAPVFSYPSRRPLVEPIWTNEKLIYDITYFGVSGGEFTLESLPHKAISNRKVYHIRGTAVSSKVFSMFYRINDTVETFIDYDGLFSHRFHLLLDETKQSRDSLELYDSEKKQTFYWNRWNHHQRGYTETKEFTPMEPFSNDTLSALYYLRTVPLPDGAVITVPIVSEGKSWEAVVTVVRREMMDTPLGRKRTVVLKPEMKFQGILKKQGDSFLWLTDDDRRFLVRIEAKVRIGTVTGALRRVEPGTPPETSPPLEASAKPQP